MQVTIPAYAKINLFLDIQSLRNDGFHDIISLMQSISLCDYVNLSYTPCPQKIISILCNDPLIPCNENNLAYKAAQAFPINTGKIQIEIDKKIPVSAGLAGGSADAAAVLTALNIVTGKKLNNEQLIQIGATIGADIPFCIVGGACLATGKGELISYAAPMPQMPIVIAKRGDGMSTPIAYKELDKKYNNFLNYAPQKNKLNIIARPDQYTANEYCGALFNIFENVVIPQRPDVLKLKEFMKAHGALNALMSGSGTAVFGIFEKERDANAAVDALQLNGDIAHLCYPCRL